MKTERPRWPARLVQPAVASQFGEGLLPERSVDMKEARGTKTTQVNARMATADHDRQEQAAHRQYKSRIVFN